MRILGMMSRGPARQTAAAMAMWVMFCGSAQAVRVAIIAENQPDLETALAAALSKQAGIELMERKHLERIAAESSVSAQPLRLDGGDLIVIVDEKSGDLIPVRLVDARTGALIHSSQIPATLDAADGAEWLAARCVPYLRWPPDHSLRRFALTGLRFAVDSAQYRQTERALNLALAAALQSSGVAVVLERWKLHDLVFEKTLRNAEASKFWEAADVLDGSITEKDGLLFVRLRIRKPAPGAETIVEMSGPSTDLNTLAARLAAGVNGRDSPGAQDAAWEAKIYQDEAEWLLSHRLTREAIQAAESAVGLGESSQAAEILRIVAYACDAYPNFELRRLTESGDFYDPEAIPASRISGCVASATAMSALARDYIRKYPAMKKPVRRTFENPAELGVQSLTTGLKVLRAAYDHGYWQTHPEEVRILRQALRDQIDAVQILLLADNDRWSFELFRPLFYLHLTFYAGYWNETPEDAIRYYNGILSRDFAGKCRNAILTARKGLKANGAVIFSEVLSPRASNCDWTTKPPYTYRRLIDWKNPGDPSAEDLWKNFIQVRLNSADVLAQADGLQFLWTTSRTYEDRLAACGKISEFLSSHLDDLSGPDGEAIGMQLYRGVDDICRLPELEVQRAKLSRHFQDLLNNGRVIGNGIVSQLGNSLFESRTANPEEGRAILDALARYENAIAPTATNQAVADIHSARAGIYRRFPALTAKAPEDALNVTRAWIPGNHLNGQPRSNVLFDEDSGVWHEGRLWFLDPMRRRLWKIDPRTFQTELVDGINQPEATKDTRTYFGGNHLDSRNSQPVFFGGKMYLPEHGDVWAYRPKENRWSRLNLPDAHYSLWQAGGSLYASYGELSGKGEQRRGEGAGLYRIHAADDSFEQIFSTRRRPPIHPLDGNACERPFCVFAAEDGQPIVGLLPKVIGFRKLSDGAEWTTIPIKAISNFTSRNGEILFLDTTTAGGTTFLQNVLRMTREGRCEVLLWNPENPVPAPQAPVWEYPGELLRSSKISGSNRRVHRVAMSAEDLYVLVSEPAGAPSGTPQCDLYVFRRGKPDGRRIRLVFSVSQAMEDSLSSSYFTADRFRHPAPSNEGFLAIDGGLVIVAENAGFWFIPGEDLEKALSD